MNEYTTTKDNPNVNRYEVRLRSGDITHLSLIMYATSREELASKLGSRIITMGDVAVALGDEIDNIDVVILEENNETN